MPGPEGAPGHPEHLEDTGPLLGRCRQLLVPEVFPRLWCLPDLGEVVPLELDVADARRVGDPGSDQLGPGRDQPDHEPPPQSCPTRSTGSPRRSSCAASQSAYSSIVAPKPAGRALSNPGSDSATVSGRSSAASRPCQTAGVSGTPWTKTAVMAPILSRRRSGLTRQLNVSPAAFRHRRGSPASARHGPGAVPRNPGGRHSGPALPPGASYPAGLMLGLRWKTLPGS